MKTAKIILTILFVSVVGFAVYRSLGRKTGSVYKTVTPQRRTIEEIIYLPGNVFPAREIEIKPQLSGILEDIKVKIGDRVQEGAPIASVKLVPGTFDLERTESSVNTARIEYAAREVEYERAKRLFETRTISKAEMDEYARVYNLAKENLNSATNQLSILEKGRIASKNISNVVKSSTPGTVIDLPLETGSSVIERNNYNPGTTVAVVAETSLFKFRAFIAEHYLRHLSLGDSIRLTFNAYEDMSTNAVITKISSKGNPENGIMKYMMEAEFRITDGMPVLRSGYSATAGIVLNRRDSTLCVEEKYIVYRNDSTYLYVAGSASDNSGKVKKLIATGVSDGAYTEIVDGVSPDELIITNYDKTD